MPCSCLESQVVGTVPRPVPLPLYRHPLTVAYRYGIRQTHQFSASGPQDDQEPLPSQQEQ